MSRVYAVAQSRPDADDRGHGSEQQPFRTIAPAARLAQPGDTVRIHAGIYREWVAPARGGTEDEPITYGAARGDTVIIRGTEQFANYGRGIDRDFVGHPISTSPLAGALQELTPGTHRIRLWSVPFTRPAMPPRVNPQPLPAARDVAAVARPPQPETSAPKPAAANVLAN